MSNSLWPHDCSLPGSSVFGVLQARTLEWVAVSFSRGSLWLRSNPRLLYWQANSLLLNSQGSPLEVRMEVEVHGQLRWGWGWKWKGMCQLLSRFWLCACHVPVNTPCASYVVIILALVAILSWVSLEIRTPMTRMEAWWHHVWGHTAWKCQAPD